MSQLRDVAVKVNGGSGVLVKLNKKSYVITAIHCINESGDNTILSADEKRKYEVQEMFFHPKREQDIEKKNEGDIVLLKVKGIGDFVSYEMTNNVYEDDEIKAYGFPTKNRKGEPLEAKVSQWNRDIKTIKTDSTYIGSNQDDEEAINNIEGWSGSGVFKKILGEYVLVGILKSLTHAEHIYQTINCISMDTIYEVIKHYDLAIIEKKNQNITSVPKINKDFIGREKELASIGQKLKDDNVVCVVNGIGGVGKSELSYKYFHENRHKYNKLIFVELTENQSFEDTFLLLLKNSLSLPNDTDFNTIIRLLQQYPKQNLLLLDNLQKAEDFKLIEPLNNNFDILITTREEIDESNSILNLDILDKEDAKELFLSIYPTDENIDDILKYLDNHPLFIKLIAYSLKRRFTRLSYLREDIRDGKIAKINSKDRKTFKAHLQNRFSQQFQNEQDNELKKLLQTLALLPSIEINIKILEQILGNNRIEGELQLLVSSGWLINKEDSYKLHQIIKLFIQEEYPIEYENITYILDNIGNYINPDDSTLIASQLSDYIPIIDSLLTLFGDRKDDYIASILDSNSYLYHSLGDYNNSLKMQEKSLSIRKELYIEKSEEVAKSYGLLGVIYKAKGDYGKTEPLYEKALKISEEILGENHPDTASSYNNLALLYKSKGDYDKAEPLYEKALKIREELLGENHPDTASSYNNLAGLYYSKGDYDKAEPLFEKALKISEEVLGENHPNTASNYNNLALLYDSKGDYDKAEPLFEKALKISEEILGENHPDTASSYNNLALLYKSKGDYDKAEPLYEKALKIREELLGENHPDTASSYNNLAGLYYSKGDYDKAELLYEKALKISEEVLGENHPDTATSYNNLASLYESKGDYDKAEPLYEKALKIKEELLGENHPDTATSYNNLAGFYKDRKQCQKAKVYLEKVIASVEKLEYKHIDLRGLKKALKEVNDSLKKEKKLKYNKKGRFCRD